MAEFYLTGKLPAFVASYVDNELAGGKLTPTQVALRAGYSAKNATVQASKALANNNVIQAIAERKRLLAEQAAGLVDVDAKRVLREWAEIAVADPTDVITVRRLNCRHCYGFAFGYQYTNSEYARETANELESAETERRPADLQRFQGGPGFVQVRDPNKQCPECCGEGVEDVSIKDFRKLTAKQRRLIAGVKQGKHGIEVQFRDQDGALKNLAQYLGLLVNRNEHAGPNGGPIPHATVNYTLPSDPMEAARAYQLLMEGKV